MESLLNENKIGSDEKDHIISEKNLLLNELQFDNSKLVKALKKARDHIINQDSLMKDLQTELKTFQLQNSELSEEISCLKLSYETERNLMNRVLTELGNSIQKSNL